MNMQPDQFSKRLRAVFNQVFRRNFSGDNISVDEMEEWDSLSHIKLIIEIEKEFDIEIDPDRIPSLYSNFSTILRLLQDSSVGE